MGWRDVAVDVTGDLSPSEISDDFSVSRPCNDIEDHEQVQTVVEAEDASLVRLELGK